MLISDYLDICDPVLTFDRVMEEIELEKYLNNIPKHYTGRLRMLRLACGLTQEEFCNVIGISDTHYRSATRDGSR